MCGGRRRDLSVLHGDRDPMQPLWDSRQAEGPAQDDAGPRSRDHSGAIKRESC